MIIDSLLDTDLYKFTMMQVVFHQHRDAEVEYQLICRTPGVDFSPLYDAIEHDIDHLCTLSIQADELDYLKTLNYFQADFLAYLQTFSLNKAHIQLHRSPFSLTIKGPWLHTILFETPLLAIISEHYTRRHETSTEAEGLKRLNMKIDWLLNADTKQTFELIEFGTRRRFSKTWHHTVLTLLKERLPKQLTGTSNVHFAKTLALDPSGTMAHEFLQAHQAFTPDLAQSQKNALQCWLKEYPDVLGIALSDVIGLRAFLQDFDVTLAKAYRGVRHDSGDPIIWGDALLNHYHQLGINPAEKSLIFSNSLTFQQAFAIQRHFQAHIRTCFGIGTYLTHDLGHKPPDIVIKMTRCNHQPVAKISDAPGKSVCQDHAYLEKLKKEFALKS